MKQRRFTLMGLACFLSTFGVAQTNQNFNSTGSSTVAQVKDSLEQHCWLFPGFQSQSASGWTGASIEGDGCLVSDEGASSSQNAGISTPVLSISGTLQVAFKYRFKEDVAKKDNRWIKVLLTDLNNSFNSKLDSIDISDSKKNKTYSYSKSFSASGSVRVFLSYQGTGNKNYLAIDDIIISASSLFPNGCAVAPTAVNDNIGGQNNHNANGNVLGNDTNPAGNSSLRAYLVQDSPDGTVTLNTDGSFTFSPNPDFSGSSTSFVYKACLDGVGSALCSNDATATINFPAGSSLPVSLIDFAGLYKNNGQVELKWTTTFEQNNKYFEIERSLDGTRWEAVGRVNAVSNAGDRNNYTFTDNVGRNTANKKDLYYRLKQVDTDSKVNLSKILVVRVYNTKTLKMISVTPNPVKNDINASIQLNERSVVVLKVIAANGSVVMRKSLMLEAGTNRVSMEGSGKLTPGMYSLEMIVNSRDRMIVQLIKD